MAPQDRAALGEEPPQPLLGDEGELGRLGVLRPALGQA
jgi:hypothetical protein